MKRRLIFYAAIVLLGAAALLELLGVYGAVMGWWHASPTTVVVNGAVGILCLILSFLGWLILWKGAKSSGWTRAVGAVIPLFWLAAFGTLAFVRVPVPVPPADAVVYVRYGKIYPPVMVSIVRVKEWTPMRYDLARGMKATPVDTTALGISSPSLGQELVWHLVGIDDPPLHWARGGLVVARSHGSR